MLSVWRAGSVALLRRRGIDRVVSLRETADNATDRDHRRRRRAARGTAVAPVAIVVRFDASERIRHDGRIDTMRIRSIRARLWRWRSRSRPLARRAHRLRRTQRRSRFPSPSTDRLTPWLQTRGELRTRVEGFTGGGFGGQRATPTGWIASGSTRPSARRSRSRSSCRSRTRARSTRPPDRRRAPFRNTLDLRMAYGEIGSTQHRPRSAARSWRSASSA